MDGRIIGWDDRYSVGIQLIDDQHKELIKLTNKLYSDCLTGGEGVQDYFKFALRRTMDYVEYHSASEEQFLEKVRYPDLQNHRKQHEDFFREVAHKARNFENGKPLVPKAFVCYLRDWVLTHIAFIDRKYATYLQILKTQALASPPPPSRRPGFQFPGKHLQPDYSPPPEMFWG
jgi:hemerythrin